MTTPFQAVAAEIMYRWSADRDTWVTASEIAQARAYLDQVGIATTPLETGGLRLERTGHVVNSARLVLLSLQHFVAVRQRTGR